MAKSEKAPDAVQPIIVKKIKKGGGGHHGGAWKVAYADFVTAMMAFFLLLWLLNVATEDQLQVISSYFDPSHPKVSERTSGAGGVMGGLSMSTEGAMATDVQPLTAPSPTGAASMKQAEIKTDQATYEEMTAAEIEQMQEQLKKQEDERFKEAAEELQKEIAQNPELAELAKNLIVDITPEGLRIQVVDQEGKPMFALGSAEMYDYTRKLMTEVAKVVRSMPNDVSVRGHTDAHKYADGAKYTNWELSADRANSSRRVLLDTGVDVERLANVMGKADRDNLVKDPLDPRNRRISIILLREDVQHAIDRGAFGKGEPATPVEHEDAAPTRAPVGTFQKTPGAVYFP